MPALSETVSSSTTLKGKIFYGLFGKLGAWIRRFTRNIDDLVYSDRWIFLSSGFAENAKSIFCSNVFPSRNMDKIGFIHNPIKINDAQAHTVSKEKIVLYVGRIVPWKRVNLLLDIWSRLKRKGCTDGWKFIVVGDGTDLQDEKRYAQEIGCSDVIFTGFQDPAEFYAKSQIFVTTSASEGFGMVLVEAQVNGCVPVAFDSFASLHDIIASGENGIIVRNNDLDEFASQLHNLMSNEQLRQSLADNAMKSCRKFSVEKIADQWEELVSELCD